MHTNESERVNTHTYLQLSSVGGLLLRKLQDVSVFINRLAVVTRLGKGCLFRGFLRLRRGK